MIKKVLRYMGNILLVLIILILGMTVYGNIQSKGRDWVVPTIGQYRWLTVLSGSMKPVFNPGDLIIDKKVDATKLKVGEVVTYMDAANLLYTHRIVEVVKSDKGNITFKTKGDSNNAADKYLIPSNMVVGQYAFRIPYLGFVIEKLKGLTGVIAIWILFVLVTGTEIYKIVKNKKSKEALSQ